MPRTITLDDDAVALVVEALRNTAELRARTATRAAGELARAKNAGTIKDDRPGAVRVARFLADADTLGRAADLIARTPDDVDVEVTITDTASPALAAAAAASHALVVRRPAGQVGNLTDAVEPLTEDALVAAVAAAHVEDRETIHDLAVRDEDLADVDAVLDQLAAADA